MTLPIESIASIELLKPHYGSGSAASMHMTADCKFVPPSFEILRVFQFGALPQNWDSMGSDKPRQESIRTAVIWLPALQEAARDALKPWMQPHISASEVGDISFEWWRNEMKLTLYFGQAGPEYIKVWGPNIQDEMASGVMRHSRDFTQLWAWLFS